MTTRLWTRAVSAAIALAAAAPALASDEGEPNIFAGGIGNAVITLIIFGSVVLILGKFAWPPLIKVLDDRQKAIRESLENAKREREASEELLKQYQEKIDSSREEATAIVEEGKRDAEDVRRRIHEEARSEANQMVERAKREIQLATDTAVKELYDKTAELSVRVAAGIIRKELSARDHEGLVTESLERMKNEKMN